MGSICLSVNSNNRIFYNIQETLYDQHLWVLGVAIVNENLNLKENTSWK